MGGLAPRTFPEPALLRPAGPTFNFHLRQWRRRRGVVRRLSLRVPQRLDDASQQFDNALDSSQTNIPAILGKACVHYHQKEYRKALVRFSAAITLHPNASNGASVRVGLGLCWLKLGHTALAHAAFDRALALDAANVDALVAKGVLQQWPTEGQRPEAEKARIEAAGSHVKFNRVVVAFPCGANLINLSVC